MKLSDLSTKTKIILGTAPLLALMVVFGVTMVVMLDRIRTTNEQVEHTYRVLGEQDAVAAAAVDMETGMRGFLLGGRDEFLEPYRAGETFVFDAIASLRQTVADNPRQVERLNEVERALRQWQSEAAEPGIASRRQVGQGGAMSDVVAFASEGRGKAFFDRFRALLDEFEAEERSLMEVRQAGDDASFGLATTSAWVLMLGGIVVGIGLSWRIGAGIARPLATITEKMGVIATGDYEVAVPHGDRRDEVGDIARALEVFKQAGLERKQLTSQLAGSFEAQVGGVIRTVGTAAAQVARTADGVKRSATTTTERTAAVAAASEQASANVQTVAAATEEMAASVSEINGQVVQTRKMTDEAMVAAGRMRETMAQLAESANQIGTVVELITTIADQTNLLSLNATIEAARAGEAGRGFAVVAQEVKSLAGQTRKATDDIARQIDALQEACRATGSDIENVGDVICGVAEVATSIATAMEQQSGATQEIARNVQEAAVGNTDVSRIVAEVAKLAREGDRSAEELTTAAGALTTHAADLETKVREFLAGLRAA